MIPNPKSLIGESSTLPEVEQIGTITVQTLNLYHCNNPDRRLLCLNGYVFDVTSGENSYGPDGAYKEYAGHDITLALAMHKTDAIWLDRFVKMKDKWKVTASGWEEYFKNKYPIAGKLENWDTDPETWPELSPEELESLEKGCSIM
jgi:cytochrome b involved in lipid metabolism